MRRGTFPYEICNAVITHKRAKVVADKSLVVMTYRKSYTREIYFASIRRLYCWLNVHRRILSVWKLLRFVGLAGFPKMFELMQSLINAFLKQWSVHKIIYILQTTVLIGWIICDVLMSVSFEPDLKTFLTRFIKDLRPSLHVNLRSGNVSQTATASCVTIIDACPGLAGS